VPKKKKLINFLTTTLSHELERSPVPPDKQRLHAIQLLEQIYQNIKIQLPTNYRDEIFRDVIDEIFNYGPIQVFLDDPEV
jgi:hypothetical protein